MSEIRSSKSLESLSASLNRALAGARAPQVAAARQAGARADQTDATRGRAAAYADKLASRRRTNLLLGTLDGFRHGVGARRGTTPARPARPRPAGG